MYQLNLYYAHKVHSQAITFIYGIGFNIFSGMTVTSIFILKGRHGQQLSKIEHQHHNTVYAIFACIPVNGSQTNLTCIHGQFIQ